MDKKYIFEKKILAMRIKEARKKQNLTQENLSNLIGVNVNTIAKWESPKNKLTLGYTNLVELANALGISIDFLFMTEQAKEEQEKSKQKLDSLIAKLTDREKNIIQSLAMSLIENRL